MYPPATKARIEPSLARDAAPSELQSSAAIRQTSTSAGARPAAVRPVAMVLSVCARFSAVSPKLMKTSSADAAAPASALGPEADRKTGLGRVTHGRFAAPSRQEAGSP